MREVETNKSRSPRKHGIAEARTGLFRATLLFGSIAAALSLIVLPSSDRHARQVAADMDAVDPMVTGSIARGDRDLVRRDGSSLHQGPCLLFPDGTQRGAC